MSTEETNNNNSNNQLNTFLSTANHNPASYTHRDVCDILKKAKSVDGQTSEQSECVTFCNQPFASKSMIKPTLVESLAQIISLYEFFLLILIFPIIIVSTQNVFLVLLWLGLMSKYIPELACKYFFTVQNRFQYWFRNESKVVFTWAQNPTKGKKCGFFCLDDNTPNTQESAFPSGHVFTMSLFAWYMTFKFTQFFSKIPNSKQITFIVLLMIAVIVIANLRIKLNCNSSIQTIFGALFGAIWAIFVYFAIEEIVKRSARIQSDENKFLALFSDDV